jgi:TatD DNase family protein
MRLVDTHCHLDFERFDDDRESVITRAAENGLERLLVPAIDLDTSRAAVKLSLEYESVYAAVGVQPNSGLSWKDSTLKELIALADNARVVAIGEIGLDYYWDKAPKNIQHSIFEQQLDLAQQLQLPVIIHNREATEDTLAILLTWQQGLLAADSPLADRPGVLHSYSGDAAQAQQALAAGFYLGISGPVTFKNAHTLHQVVAEVPIERLLLETDAPYLTPHPYRGQRNEPAYVRYMAEKISEIKNMPLEQVAQNTTENATRLFKW